MRRLLLFLVSSLLLQPAFLFAQNPAPPQPNYQTVTTGWRLLNPPVPATGLTIQQVGNPGPSSQTYYYWIVTHTLIGHSSPIGPIAGNYAPTTLNSSNYFQLYWNVGATVTASDVLRTTTPAPPVGACACAVATNTSATTVNDQSNSLSAYTVATFDPNQVLLFVDNEAQSSGVSHLILRQGPAGTLVCDLSVGCGGVGGGVGGSGTANILPIWTAGTTLGNSGVSEPSGVGNGLQYSGSSFSFDGSGASITSLIPGVQIFVTTANTSGSTQAGGFSVIPGQQTGTGTGGILFLGGGLATSGAGGPATVEAGNTVSGVGGLATIQGGSSTTGFGGYLYLNPGFNNSETNGKNGIIVLDTGQDRNMAPLYFPEVSFANLLVPIANPFAFPSASANGATEWCDVCNGAVDNAPQGSVAGGSSGHGALIMYETSTPAWRVVSGVGTSASGTVNNATQYSFPFYSVTGTTNTLSGVSAPTTDGTYYAGYAVIGGVAVSPTALQAGVPSRVVSGATTADPVLYSDVGGFVTHAKTASGTLVETLPTPTTLGNANFGFKYCNNSPQTDTVSAAGSWTIQAGTAAGTTTPLSVSSGSCYAFRIDPSTSTQWLAN